MEINRISGGMEYRPELLTLVLPGDQDYRVRTARTSEQIDVRPSQSHPVIVIDSWSYNRVDLSAEGINLSRHNGLELLRRLGEMEAEGVIPDYPGMNLRDEFAGGHSGIIDIRV
ncbi:MAG: hypothetical protein GX577_11035 [Leptolinea sp.]|nr:hypothetical protein [Leptolinea sp.]